MSFSNTNNSSDYNIMTLTGEGQLTVEPDTAILHLGVETTGNNLSSIQEENATLSQAVLKAIQQQGISEIKTYQYIIQKLVDTENGDRVDRGFSVRNIFEIKTENMDQIGKIIDTAVYYGANVVDFISFEVSNAKEYYFQALNLAVINACEKAISIAETIGVICIPTPRRITENSAMPIPFQSIALREGFAATPVEAGSLDVRASVTAEFIYY